MQQGHTPALRKRDVAIYFDKVYSQLIHDLTLIKYILSNPHNNISKVIHTEL